MSHCFFFIEKKWILVEENSFSRAQYIIRSALEFLIQQNSKLFRNTDGHLVTQSFGFPNSFDNNVDKY